MKLGLFVPFHRIDDSISQKELYRQSLDVIRFAEDAGFASAWLPEHHLIEYIACPSPLMLIVAAAERTSRIRLGTAIMVAPYYNPLRLAGEIGLADILTEGRLDIGFGRGAFEYEFERFGVDEKIASRRLRETLEVISGLLTKDDFVYDGEFQSFPASTAVPKSLQKPMPPVWIAARSPESIRWAIENGYNQLMTPWRESFDRVRTLYELREGIVKEVNPAIRPKVAMSRMTFVGETDGEALEAMQDVQIHHRLWTRLFTGQAKVTAGFAEPEPVDDEYPPELLFENLVAGDPDRCIQKLKQYEAVGVDEFIVYVGFRFDHEAMMKSLRLFAERVMPAFG
jgi:alkanesulfonate monooxygenase SsuD/methylene tetrahydromethanopterin reductase-like flavin-dependent oxidoreductase (luciferase family)